METATTTETSQSLEPTKVTDMQEIAFKMRLYGKSLTEICEALPYEDTHAIVEDLRKRFEVESEFLTATGRESLLLLQIARLELLLTGTMPSAELGDPGSTNTALKIIDMISKHANLYEPDTERGQHTVLVIGGHEADYVEKLKKAIGGDL